MWAPPSPVPPSALTSILQAEQGDLEGFREEEATQPVEKGSEVARHGAVGGAASDIRVQWWCPTRAKGQQPGTSRSASRGLDEAPRSGARHKLILSREQCLHERARESSITNSDVPLLPLLCTNHSINCRRLSLRARADGRHCGHCSCQGATWSFWTWLSLLPLLTD